MVRVATFLLCFLIGLVSAAQVPEGYYDGTDGLDGEELKVALHDIIKGHKKYPYSHKTKTDVWDILKEADEVAGKRNKVELIYTGRVQRKSNNSGEKRKYTGNRWNREHLWPKSHGFPKESDTAFTDCHHIRAADESVNTNRSTRDFADGGIEHEEAVGCYYNDSLWSWEVRDDMKGDVARSILYMVVRYDPGYHRDGSLYDLELVNYTNTDPDDEGLPLLGNLNTLLLWHKYDPVDDREIARMEVVFKYQGNRNPFVDRPEFVWRVWGE